MCQVGSPTMLAGLSLQYIGRSVRCAQGFIASIVPVSTCCVINLATLPINCVPTTTAYSPQGQRLCHFGVPSPHRERRSSIIQSPDNRYTCYSISRHSLNTWRHSYLISVFTKPWKKAGQRHLFFF